MMEQATNKKYHRVLTIAGSDSGGGAGVQADLKTISALGCYGMSAFAALTAQNTQEVRAIHEVPPSFLEAQIDAVIEDIGVDAVKIGMLFNADLIKVVARSIDQHQLPNVVLDPVMVAQSGAQLIKDNAVEALSDQLFPLCRVITPNIPEAEKLLNHSIKGEKQMEDAAKGILQMGPDAVLLKGGHRHEAESADCLAVNHSNNKGAEIHWFRTERVDTENTHGTGCTLSSAIAAQLAQGDRLDKAVQAAKDYIIGAIRAGAKYQIGQGSGPLHHFYQFWN